VTVRPGERTGAPTGVTTGVRTPALYDGVVTHVRNETFRRSFAHRVYYWLVDLDELPRQPRWLRPFAGFRAADHLGDSAASLRANVDAWLAARGIDLRGGRIVMLTNARVLGYVFNPITLYWCHRPDGALECVLAEVHNTYHQRHTYLLHPDGSGKALADKEFYVSPFLDQHGTYEMRVPEPDERLSVTVTLRQDGGTPLTAVLRGARRPAGPAGVLRTVLRRPLLPQRVSALIRAHGIVLWLRRIPIRPRPAHDPQPADRTPATDRSASRR
jgi:uncharacterized protein